MRVSATGRDFLDARLLFMLSCSIFESIMSSAVSRDRFLTGNSAASKAT